MLVNPAAKLGLHISRPSPDHLEWLHTHQPAVIVLLDPSDAGWIKEARAACRSTKWIFRWYEPDQTLRDTYHSGLLKKLEALDPHSQLLCEGVIGLNEIVVNTQAEMRAYAHFEAVRTKLLNSAGYHCVAFNFSTGCPDLNLWQFASEVFTIPDAQIWLGLHEYDAPTMWDWQNWLCLRYRQVWSKLPATAVVNNLKIVMTECGFDWGVVANKNATVAAESYRNAPFKNIPQNMRAPRIFAAKDALQTAGWRNRISKEFYWQQLCWYNAQLVEDDYVLGGAVYCDGTWPEWEPFNIRPEITDQWPTGAGAPPPVEPPPTPVDLTPRVEALETQVQALLSWAGKAPR